MLPYPSQIQTKIQKGNYCSKDLYSCLTLRKTLHLLVYKRENSLLQRLWESILGNVGNY